MSFLRSHFILAPLLSVLSVYFFVYGIELQKVKVLLETLSLYLVDSVSVSKNLVYANRQLVQIYCRQNGFNKYS